ncbi:hypothetical protein Tfer_3260 [Thermincola ferriacetica]|uniref:DUF5343 domain-containing protein n=1 Tax=Thermincola ferriacetica TaxID=281456 RepID=A0A0L6VXZ8_9FIRM|nr:DUF5343 domain-containing protein [Thermincola ferriacetica]KNZ68207.1 hypothetical protein Tfer_3260 [Thermincola ferriacetica]
MAEKQSYPRIPASNWWTLRSQFQKTLPTVVTASYLKSLLNLTNEKGAANLLSPLKQMGLIDDDNKPTQRANDWRSDAKYEDTCREILKDVYPQELLDLFPGPEIDKKAVADWFMHTAALGKSAAEFTAATFILLNQPLSAMVEEKVKKPKTQSAKAKANGTNQPKSRVAVTSNIETSVPVTSTVVPGITTPSAIPTPNQTLNPSLHIDLQIHISPEATPEQIDTIFASIAKHLYAK